MSISPIPRKRYRYTNVVKIISSNRGYNTEYVQLVRKITFYYHKDGNIRQQTTIGTSTKRRIDEEDELEVEAFASAMAQISFSWDRFKERDRAYIWYRPIIKPQGRKKSNREKEIIEANK